MKIIVFGIGKVFNKVKHCFYEDKTEVVALVDNSSKLCGNSVDGYMVDVPEHIQQYQYDYIVITSSCAVEMRQQLIELGICPEKIIHYKDYIGSLPVETPVTQMDALNPNVLILSNDFGYHGGAIACISLARVLRRESYLVTIAVPSAERKLLEEFSSEEGIKVIVIDYLESLSNENLEWTREYSYVFANTIVMLRCAVKLAQNRNVYLWIHESIDSYSANKYWYDEIRNGIEGNKLIIGAVSEVAKKNFLSFFQTEKEIAILPYGFDDRYKRSIFSKGSKGNDVTTFIVVANHAALKGLDILLDALDCIPMEAKNKCRFLFVGKANSNEHGKLIKKRIDETANCEYLGELSREKLFDVYSWTDIIIVPSRRDSLPLVAAEAMMLKKPCIISDAVGTAAYIKHGHNGLIFKSEDREELAGLICWCLENKAEMASLAENARETYEKWFTMDKFRDRIRCACELL